MTDDFEDMLRKKAIERKYEPSRITTSASKDNFLRDLEEHIDTKITTKKPVRTERYEPDEEEYSDEEEQDEEKEDLDEEDIKELDDELKNEKKTLSYRERIEQRKRRQLEWKEQKMQEREKQRQLKRLKRQKRDEKQNSLLRNRDKQHETELRDDRDDDEEEPNGEAPTRKSIRFRRNEERKVLRPMKKDKKKWTPYKAVTMMVAFAVMFLIFMYSYAPQGGETQKTVFEIMVILGMTLFLPVGMLIGWAVLDPFMRCRVMRRATRKNLGVVCFVSKGKRIITQVKNFDDSLIWVKNKCWAIRRNKIYEIDKYGEKVGEGENIEPEDLVIMTETVPMIFFDVDNMMPLSLHETNIEEVAPDELGPALKGWVDNQQAKLLFMKRTMEMFYMVILIVSVGSLFLAYQNYTKMEEMTKILNAIQSRLASMTPSTPAGLFSFFGF